MDRYVSKPIEIEKLPKALLKHPPTAESLRISVAGLPSYFLDTFDLA